MTQEATENHEAIMEFIDVTEKQCNETYSSIKNRLTYLKDLSLSNMALRRLVKRN